MSYGEWLVWLENADYGRNGLRESLCHIVTPGLEKLDRAEVSLSYKYQFPVHAVGYNWLQSNAVSAARLAGRIDQITAYYREQFPLPRASALPQARSTRRSADSTISGVSSCRTATRESFPAPTRR